MRVSKVSKITSQGWEVKRCDGRGDVRADSLVLRGKQKKLALKSARPAIKASLSAGARQVHRRSLAAILIDSRGDNSTYSMGASEGGSTKVKNKKGQRQ